MNKKIGLSCIGLSLYPGLFSIHPTPLVSHTTTTLTPCLSQVQVCLGTWNFTTCKIIITVFLANCFYCWEYDKVIPVYCYKHNFTLQFPVKSSFWWKYVKYTYCQKHSGYTFASRTWQLLCCYIAKYYTNFQMPINSITNTLHLSIH